MNSTNPVKSSEKLPTDRKYSGGHKRKRPLHGLSAPLSHLQSVGKQNYSEHSIHSIAIGSFDGIHIAHRHLIDQADAVVVIERGSGYLTPGYKRSCYVDKPIFFYMLDDIRDLSAAGFVQRLQADFPSLEKMVVGYDFHFGQGREGDAEHLSMLFDGEVVIVDEVMLDGVSVHSRVIRKYLEQGDIKTANHFLGRRYCLDGEVTAGQGLGAKELVPTLNLKVVGYQLPIDGVYATRTYIAGDWYDSVSFFGHRVTTDGSYAVETHVIERDIGVVRGEVRVEFVGRIRDNKRFDDFEQLRQQIMSDIKSAKQIGNDNER